MTQSALIRDASSRSSVAQSFIAFMSFVEKDPTKAAFGEDAAATLVEGGAVGVTTRNGIYEESTLDQLPAALRQVIVASFNGKAIQIILFILCAVCGSMLPLTQQYTKEYPKTYSDADGEIHSCQGKAGHTPDCKGSLPYLPGTAILVESIVSLSVGLAMTYVLSGKEGLWHCVNPVRLKQILPISLIYVASDIVQLLAIGATNASFFLVVGQVKLLATAVISKFVMKTSQSTAQWYLLGAITVAAALYCDLDLYLVQKKDRAGMEIYGLTLSLVKVGLASLNAVFTERAFKASPSEPIWVNQAQLKLCSVPCSVLALVLQHGIMCNHDKKDCLFSDAGFFEGWSSRNIVLLVVQVFNNFILGLIYKKVNAVVKYLAYAQSLWITYFINVLMLGTELYLDLFLVVVLLVLLVIAYSFAKLTPTPSPKPVDPIPVDPIPMAAGPIPMPVAVRAGSMEMSASLSQFNRKSCSQSTQTTSTNT